jgi:hypothetical protein
MRHPPDDAIRLIEFPPDPPPQTEKNSPEPQQQSSGATEEKIVVRPGFVRDHDGKSIGVIPGREPQPRRSKWWVGGSICAVLLLALMAWAISSGLDWQVDEPNPIVFQETAACYSPVKV